MSYNRKAITDALSKMNKAKKPKQPKDIIKDPEGQYKYPGVPTRIASDNITMQGVPYPVLGVDNLGNQQMMQPGAEYVFPGADYVDEFPIAKYGGLVTGLTNTSGNLLMSEQGKRMMAQSDSLSDTNKMFLGNPMVTKRKKSVFVPGAPFQEGGNPSDPGMDAMMKARFAYAHMHGNPAAQRMTYPVDNPYIFTGTEPYTNPDMAGEFGTHYMFSQDNYAVPTIQQDEYGNLIYNPEANYTNPEAIQFDRPEDAQIFAEFYKLIAPGMQTGGSTDWKSRIASAMNFQKGGQLSKEEFEKRKAAYKKMTGRDFEPPKSFRPTQQSREYYQNRANQQPVVQTQPSETTQQSRKMSANEVQQLKVQNAPTDPRINRYAFEKDNRDPYTQKRDQYYAEQITDPTGWNKVGHYIDAATSIAGNLGNTLFGGDDWKNSLQNFETFQLNPYNSKIDKLTNRANMVLSNVGNAAIDIGTAELGFAIPQLYRNSFKKLLEAASKANMMADVTQIGQELLNFSQGDLAAIGNILLNTASYRSKMNNFDASTVYHNLKNWKNITKDDKIDTVKDIFNLFNAGYQQSQRTDPMQPSSFYKEGGQMSREEFEKRKAAYKKLTGRDLTEKNVATIKQQQNLQKFIDDKKPLEKKLPTSEAEAMAMIESGELKIETIAQQQAREKREADAREADRIARLKAYEKRQADPNYGIGLTPLPGETWRDFWAAEGSNLDAVFRTSQEDNFFDDYINPLVWIGSMAKNLGESPQQAKQTGSLLPYITAVGTPLVMGAIGGTGATNTGQFVNNLVNPVAGLGTGMLNRFGRRSFTPYLDDIGLSLNPRTISNTPRQLPGSSNAALPPNTRPQLNIQQQRNAELLSEWVNNRGMTGQQLLNFSQRDPDWLRLVEDYVTVTGDRQGINAFLAGGNRRIPTYRSNILDTQPIQNIINTGSIDLRRNRLSAPVIFDPGTLFELATGKGVSLGSANTPTFRNLTTSLVKKPAQKLQNVLTNLDKKMGAFLEKNISTAKKPISITDIEKEVNLLLEKGVGVKKAKDVKIKLETVPGSIFGEAAIHIDIKDYFKNNKKLLQDAYPDSDIDAWIESVPDGWINSGTIHVPSTIKPTAQTRRFTEIVRGKPKEAGYLHSGPSSPIEVPGLRKKGEFPFTNWDTGLKDNILNNLGISGEYNKALNEVLKSKGYGLYSGGTGHLSDGAKRYVREFLKNRVNIVNPEQAKIFLDQLRDPEVMRLIDNALKNKNQALPPEVYSAMQNVIFKYKKKGGSIQPLDYFDTELTDQEIEQYKKGGCAIVKL